MHENANKLKNKVTFLPFYAIIIIFFSFFCQDANISGSNRPTIDCNLSKKTQIRTVSNTERRAELHRSLDYFFNILPGATCRTPWGQTSKYFRASWLAGTCVA